MKKILMALVAFMTIFAAQTASAETLTLDELRQQIALMNAICPNDMGDGMTMDSMVLTDNDFICTIGTAEDDDVINVINVMSDQFGPMYVEQFNSDPESKAILDACKAHHINMVMRMYSKNRTARADIVVKWQDM